MFISIDVNGAVVAADVEARTLLVDFLRQSGLTGTKVGCDTSSCGTCTVLFDGEPIKSCTAFAVQAEGHSVTTIEGVAAGDGSLSTLQQSFIDVHGVQCGFCTPGMVLVATTLLRDDPNPSDREIRKAIAGNMCRCTGYVNIVKAIQLASDSVRTPD